MNTGDGPPADVKHADTNFDVGTALLAETAEVRVWEVRLEPGERCPFHRHRVTYLVLAHRSGKLRAGYTNGESADFEHPAGAITLVHVGLEDMVIHDLTNVGDIPVAFTIVELLQDDDFVLDSVRS